MCIKSYLICFVFCCREPARKGLFIQEQQITPQMSQDVPLQAQAAHHMPQQAHAAHNVPQAPHLSDISQAALGVKPKVHVRPKKLIICSSGTFLIK